MQMEPFALICLSLNRAPPQNKEKKEKKEILLVKISHKQRNDEMSTICLRLNNSHWCTCSNCKVMPTENESICCQEMDLGHCLDLEGRNNT